MRKSFEVNYIFLGILFLSLLGVHGYALALLKEVPLFPYGGTLFLQCFWESWAILAVIHWMEKYAHRTFFYFFIALSCILVLAHEADFIMMRLMGVSVWYLIQLVYRELGDNFIEMIKATNIPWIVWVIGVLGVLALFGAAISFFRYTDRLAKKRKLYISYKAISLFLIAPIVLMAFWDKSTLDQLSYLNYEQFRKVLPLKKTFCSPRQTSIPLEGVLRETMLVSDFDQSKPEKKPPVFLFIIESLREDFVTKETAPNLFEFGQENVSFEIAASGGNASHLSWFTIFHSQFPLRFSKKYMVDLRDKGSLAVKAFKDMGYKIHLYTSAELAFYHMGESIFGKEYHLADTIQRFPYGGKVTADQSDQKAMEALQNDQVSFEGDGHLYIVFLDSTHFGYSWPKEMGNRFEPIDESINYLAAAYGYRSLEKIKNRYRNSIYYIDTLLGTFLSSHKEDDAVIVITGDHGEAFYEEGHIFHASTLGREQIQVPLYYKFGKESAKMKEMASKISSHIDIFPTFIDYIQGKNSHYLGLEGESIFDPARWPYTLTARYNGGERPREFCLQSLNGKAIIQNPNPKTLKIASVKGEKESSFLESAEMALSHVFP